MLGESHKALECRSGCHKEIGASMEIQEGLQAISRGPGPCRLGVKLERDMDVEDDMYNGNRCSSRASTGSTKNQTAVNSKQ